MADIKIEFETEKMRLDTMLVGGRDISGRPTSCYIGSLTPEDIHNCLFYANRAIIKLFTEKFDVPFEETEKFIMSALTEALTKEYNDKLKGYSDLEARTEMKFKKSQN